MLGRSHCRTETARHTGLPRGLHGRHAITRIGRALFPAIRYRMHCRITKRVFTKHSTCCWSYTRRSMRYGQDGATGKAVRRGPGGAAARGGAAPDGDDARTVCGVARAAGVEVHVQTWVKALRMAGIEWHRGAAGVQVEQAPADTRAMATRAHRLQAPEQTYPSSLTDAEWARVEDLFDHPGGRGTPPRYPRQLLVEACCHVVAHRRGVADAASGLSALAERLSQLSALERPRQIQANA